LKTKKLETQEESKSKAMKEYVKKSSLSSSQLVLAALGLLAGIWMLIAPSVLNYNAITVLNAATKKQVPVDLSAVTASDITAGIVLIVLGLAALLVTNTKLVYKVQMVATLGMVVAGIYLMAAPYLFDLLKVASYMSLDKPNTNDQLIGILAVVVAGFVFQRQYLASVETETTRKEAVTA
jgi:membrane protein implicated in regulation of membrane protease activity